MDYSGTSGSCSRFCWFAIPRLYESWRVSIMCGAGTRIHLTGPEVCEWSLGKGGRSRFICLSSPAAIFNTVLSASRENPGVSHYRKSLLPDPRIVSGVNIDSARTF